MNVGDEACDRILRSCDKIKFYLEEMRRSNRERQQLIFDLQTGLHTNKSATVDSDLSSATHQTTKVSPVPPPSVHQTIMESLGRPPTDLTPRRNLEISLGTSVEHLVSTALPEASFSPWISELPHTVQSLGEERIPVPRNYHKARKKSTRRRHHKFVSAIKIRKHPTKKHGKRCRYPLIDSRFQADASAVRQMATSSDYDASQEFDDRVNVRSRSWKRLSDENKAEPTEELSRILNIQENFGAVSRANPVHLRVGNIRLQGSGAANRNARAWNSSVLWTTSAEAWEHMGLKPFGLSVDVDATRTIYIGFQESVLQPHHDGTPSSDQEERTRQLGIEKSEANTSGENKIYQEPGLSESYKEDLLKWINSLETHFAASQTPHNEWMRIVYSL
ncbi:PREDICTED: uncharacterized protein LOC109129228 [Camelina sativa]|uniref:Uncharacterized protein LOC104747101 n=1 Tax=Camelina sativa TaxID=90675 RepID=A0ABM1R0I9_CAMSA|nr:PREDICTED: uncharacterized protein LOC104747101 [Camelina sativa]XP_019092527.1 PREDICTED: uncharacterized protein LOC109129228 [Camelina sativa]